MKERKRGIEHVWRHTIKIASPRLSIPTDDVHHEDDNNDDDDDHDDADDAQDNDDKDADNFSGQTLARTVGRNTFEKTHGATRALLPTDWTSQNVKWHGRWRKVTLTRRHDHRLSCEPSSALAPHPTRVARIR